MTRIEVENKALKVSITRRQKVNYHDAKRLIHKGKQIISNQNIESATVNIDKTCQVDHVAISYFEETIKKTENFPIKIVRI